MAKRAHKAGRSILGKLRGLRRDRRGATAIEFGMLALPFALLSFAILETTVSFTAQQVISNATDTLARQIRTGQLTIDNTTAAEFRDKICDEISLIVGTGCPQLEYDLQHYTKFSDVPKTIPLGVDGDIDATGFKYDPGSDGTINNLRIFYRWPVMTNVMEPSMANLPNGKRLLFSTATWQNEPF
jgi:Flp pilus assembly protein TadG